MNEATQDGVARLEPEAAAGEYVRHEVERVRRRIQDASPRERWPLYTGIEGGRLSERALAAIFSELGVPDIRTLKPIDGALADLQAEEIFKTTSPEGLELTLIRTRIEDDTPLVELQFVKPAAAA